jgi:hypothetical protein
VGRGAAGQGPFWRLARPTGEWVVTIDQSGRFLGMTLMVVLNRRLEGRNSNDQQEMAEDLRE